MGMTRSATEVGVDEHIPHESGVGVGEEKSIAPDV